MELYELIEKVRDQKRMHCMEGATGVQHLCRLCGILGYEDRMGRMGTYGGVHLGNLIDFLEDNSGCIEAILNWIGEQDVSEWKDNLESELPEEDDEELFPENGPEDSTRI